MEYLSGFNDLFAALALVLGAIIGSFLNVVSLRYNTGRTVGGRSSCPVCGKHLPWYELIPVLSFFFLHGRCSKCSAKISWRYPLVELGTAFLFLISWAVAFPGGLVNALGSSTALMQGLIAFLLLCVGWSILVVIFVYDSRHMVIPDGLSFSFAIVGLVHLLVTAAETLPGGIAGLFTWPYYLDLLAGPILFIPFWLIWKLSKGKWIGLGDGKLAWGIGWFLGLAGGLSAITFGFWIGAVIALLLLAFQNISGRAAWGKKLSLQSALPLGPFLILGTITAFMLASDLFMIRALAGF